jgi:hypothetical protein
MMPDPSDHSPECPAIELGTVVSFVLSIAPSRGAGNLMVRMWERCDSCGASTAYEEVRVPWRTFHRAWKPLVAIWLATWEHRHQVGSKVTPS